MITHYKYAYNAVKVKYVKKGKSTFGMVPLNPDIANINNKCKLFRRWTTRRVKKYKNKKIDIRNGTFKN